MPDLDKFEGRLGYAFKQRNLLLQALTHRSAAGRHNERLEFLGDAAVGFVIADLLYHRYPSLREHELTIMRASLVCKEALAQQARELELSEFLSLGAGEMKSGGHQRDSILADALEALLGAVYEDGGYAALHQVIEDRFADSIRNVKPENSKDPKTRLQEILQAHHRPLPEYVVIEHRGHPHQAVFEVECRIGGGGPVTRGKGKSRKEAEKIAAAAAITHLEQQHD